MRNPRLILTLTKANEEIKIINGKTKTYMIYIKIKAKGNVECLQIPNCIGGRARAQLHFSTFEH